MSIKEQHIEAIEKIAAKNIDDRENIKIDHQSMVSHKKKLTRNIISISEKLKREKSIQSVYLVDASKNICNENTIEHYWKDYKDKKVLFLIAIPPIKIIITLPTSKLILKLKKC